MRQKVRLPKLFQIISQRFVSKWHGLQSRLPILPLGSYPVGLMDEQTLQNISMAVLSSQILWSTRMVVQPGDQALILQRK